jgi:hypothetical protein
MQSDRDKILVLEERMVELKAEDMASNCFMGKLKILVLRRQSSVKKKKLVFSND